MQARESVFFAGRVRGALAALLLSLPLLSPLPAAGVVEKIEITQQEIVGGGRPFDLAGPYEKVAGTAFFALDPDNRANSRVVDLDKAPRDEDGMVRFTADFYLIRPRNPLRSNMTLLFEVPNRGGKAMMRYFNREAVGSFDPISAEAIGDGFLMRQGFVLAWVGWQQDLPADPERMRLDPVYAIRSAPLEGLVRADHVFAEDATTMPLGHRGHRAYAPVSPQDPRNVLTVRDTRNGKRRVIPRQNWSFSRPVLGGEPVPDQQTVYLPEGFEKGKIYEVVYVARKPVVAGLGLAAVRDMASYLKSAADSPVEVQRAIAVGISQSGRFLRHFIYQGFNRDPNGRRVFEGALIHTAGAGRGSFNHRFAQPSRDAHAYSAFDYPTDLFPFSGIPQSDPESGEQDGLFAQRGGYIPKIFFTNTGYEYWGRGASLIHTTPDGEADLSLYRRERIYHFASAQHFVDRFPPQASDTRHAANPADFLWSMRALLLALEGWVRNGAEPPPSRYPRIDASTLVTSEALAFPAIPGVEVPRQPYQPARLDFGPKFKDQGIVDNQPPKRGKPFPVLVPQVDADGNELGGIRMPEILVPVATYTPWNWRAEEIGAPDELADFRGSFLPLPPTREAREQSGDPRPSLAERYLSRTDYLGRYAEAAQGLIREGYLLEEDLAGLLKHAERLWEQAAGGTEPVPAPAADEEP